MTRYTIDGSGSYSRLKNAEEAAVRLSERDGQLRHVLCDGVVVSVVRPQRVRSNGVYDPNILKAVFLAGGPGSGKSYTADILFRVARQAPKLTTSAEEGRALHYVTGGATGLKISNSDIAFEVFLRKAGIDPADLAHMSPAEFAAVTEAPGSPRVRAKRVREDLQKSWERGRLGLILDGTGDEYDKIKARREHLVSLGYDTFMVFVNTSLEVAQARNAKRARKLPADLVEDIWRAVQENMGRFQALFGMQNMAIVDNTVYGPLPSEVVKATERFLRRPIQNPIGRAWVKDELAKKRRG